MPVYAAKGCTDVGAKQLSDSQHAIRDLGALKPRRSCTAHRAQDNIAQCFSFLPSLTAAGVGEPAAGKFGQNCRQGDPPAGVAIKWRRL